MISVDQSGAAAGARREDGIEDEAGVFPTPRKASWRPGKFFYFFGRNPLKSPDSTNLTQIKPSKSKHFCLV